MIDGWQKISPGGLTARASGSKDINPDYIIPMHCSGVNLIMAVYTTMPKTLVMPSTGTRVIFGA